jgi:hypothetical protein
VSSNPKNIFCARSSRDDFLSSRGDKPGTICRITYNQTPTLRSRTFFLSTSLPIPSSQSINRRKFVQQLNHYVRDSEQFRRADTAGKLIRIPTGDGVALAFFTSQTLQFGVRLR